MKIILAGYNLDFGSISALKADRKEQDCFTPETIAAAYARISRDPRPVNELREIALGEVEKARQSNRTIVFEMGHSSIAEHAVFNIDILGVSRLVVEEIERSRLASYTEKSQRYVTLEDDFVIPREVIDGGFESVFVRMIGEQNHGYHKIYDRLKSYIFDIHRSLAENPANRSLLEGWAKEDARYVISLATETQLGMTINARNMERMIRRLASSSLHEAREVSRKLSEVVGHVAPSLVRYVEPTDYDLWTKRALKDKAAALQAAGVKVDQRGIAPCRTADDVVLIHATADADDRVVAALLHSSSDKTMDNCLARVSTMTIRDKEAVVKTALRHVHSHDSVLREFETVDLHFELTVSATCFAQLKRHRMASITCQDYNPRLGVTVPPVVCEAGLEQDFRGIIARTEEGYGRIKNVLPEAADYLLTNAHRRRVSMKVNARELYHIARLRGDKFAQWDIREKALRMTELGRAVMPLTFMLACGKDSFLERYGQIFPAAVESGA